MIIAEADGSGDYSTLVAHLLRESRTVSNRGTNEQVEIIAEHHNSGYFSNEQLAIAVGDLSPALTISLLRRINLLDSGGGFIANTSRKLLSATVENLSRGGEQYKGSLQQLLFFQRGTSQVNNGNTIFMYYRTLNADSEEWQFEILDSLLIDMDDDVITSFVENTDYVESSFGGLYQTYHAEVFNILPSGTKRLMISKLDQGLITPFESKLIEDLSKDNEPVERENLLATYTMLIDEDPYNPENYVERGKVLADEFQDYNRAIKGL